MLCYFLLMGMHVGAIDSAEYDLPQLYQQALQHSKSIQISSQDLRVAQAQGSEAYRWQKALLFLDVADL